MTTVTAKEAIEDFEHLPLRLRVAARLGKRVIICYHCKKGFIGEPAARNHCETVHMEKCLGQIFESETME